MPKNSTDVIEGLEVPSALSLMMIEFRSRVEMEL